MYVYVYVCLNSVVKHRSWEVQVLIKYGVRGLARWVLRRKGKRSIYIFLLENTTHS